MPLGLLPFSPAWDWLRQHSDIKPLQPGFSDPTKPMPGESQIEFDMRRAALAGTGAIGGLFSSPNAGSNPIAAGGQLYDYMNAPVSRPVPSAAPAPVSAPKPAFAPQPAAAAAMPFSHGWKLTSVPGDSRDGGARVHQGWDFAPTGGDPNIRAPQPFEVIATSKSGLGGNIATVRLQDGSVYKMMHLAQLPPTGYKGDAGDIIATAGKTGNATGTTVHVQPVGGAPSPLQLFGGGGAGPALSAFAQAAGQVGLTEPRPAFDASGYQQAQGILGQVAQNQMKPFGATYNETPLPDLPKPTPLQAPDYSAGDAAFKAAMPKDPFARDGLTSEQGKLRTRRADYFAGMAQAMGSIDWSRGVGLGELFAKIGAGALMGAKAGDAEVQDRMDKFDTAMQGYNLALANRDDNKAREQINIANQNVVQMNQYARDQWQVQAKDIEAHNPRVVDGVLVTFNKNKDGTVHEQHTPLDPAKTTAAMMGQANIAMSAANAHNEYNWQTYQANRAMGAAALPYAMADAAGQGNTQGRDGVFAVGLAEAANSVTESGRWSELYQRYLPGGQQAAASRLREAYAAAGIPVDDKGTPTIGTKIDKDAQTRINAYLSTKVMEDFVNSGKSWVLVGGPTESKETGQRKINPPGQPVISSVAAQREQDRKTSRTTNYKGQTTTTERY